MHKLGIPLANPCRLFFRLPLDSPNFLYPAELNNFRSQTGCLFRFSNCAVCIKMFLGPARRATAKFDQKGIALAQIIFALIVLIADGFNNYGHTPLDGPKPSR